MAAGELRKKWAGEAGMEQGWERDLSSVAALSPPSSAPSTRPAPPRTRPGLAQPAPTAGRCTLAARPALPGRRVEVSETFTFSLVGLDS